METKSRTIHIFETVIPLNETSILGDAKNTEKRSPKPETSEAATQTSESTRINVVSNVALSRESLNIILNRVVHDLSSKTKGEGERHVGTIYVEENVRKASGGDHEERLVEICRDGVQLENGETRKIGSLKITNEENLKVETKNVKVQKEEFKIQNEEWEIQNEEWEIQKEERKMQNEEFEMQNGEFKIQNEESFRIADGINPENENYEENLKERDPTGENLDFHVTSSLEVNTSSQDLFEEDSDTLSYADSLEDLSTFKEELSTFKEDLSTFKEDLPTFKEDHPTFKDFPTYEEDISTYKEDLSTHKEDLPAYKEGLSTFKDDHFDSDEEETGVKERIQTKLEKKIYKKAESFFVSTNDTDESTRGISVKENRSSVASTRGIRRKNDTFFVPFEKSPPELSRSIADLFPSYLKERLSKRQLELEEHLKEMRDNFREAEDSFFEFGSPVSFRTWPRHSKVVKENSRNRFEERNHRVFEENSRKKGKEKGKNFVQKRKEESEKVDDRKGKEEGKEKVRVKERGRTKEREKERMKGREKRNDDKEKKSEKPNLFPKLVEKDSSKKESARKQSRIPRLIRPKLPEIPGVIIHNYNENPLINNYKADTVIANILIGNLSPGASSVYNFSQSPRPKTKDSKSKGSNYVSLRLKESNSVPSRFKETSRESPRFKTSKFKKKFPHKGIGSSRSVPNFFEDHFQIIPEDGAVENSPGSYFAETGWATRGLYEEREARGNCGWKMEKSTQTGAQEKFDVSVKIREDGVQSRVKRVDTKSIPKGWVTFYSVGNNVRNSDSSSDDGVNVSHNY